MEDIRRKCISKKYRHFVQYNILSLTNRRGIRDECRLIRMSNYRIAWCLTIMNTYSKSRWSKNKKDCKKRKVQGRKRKRIIDRFIKLKQSFRTLTFSIVLMSGIDAIRIIYDSTYIQSLQSLLVTRNCRDCNSLCVFSCVIRWVTETFSQENSLVHIGLDSSIAS